MRRAGILVFGLALIFSAVSAHAQDNLLNNPGFEGPYRAREDAGLSLPAAWEIWIGNAPQTEAWMNLPPQVSPSTEEAQVRSGDAALNLQRAAGTFTAAVYQQAAVAAGENIRASAWVRLRTCDPPAGSAACESSPASGAVTRIGIDPDGGTNPFDGDVIWSADGFPHDAWTQISVDVTAAGESVTVFLFATQQWPAGLNNVFWDDAALMPGGAGTPVEEEGTTASPAAETSDAAQIEIPSNAITYVVQAGDTIDSIAFGHGLTREDILAFNDIPDSDLIFPGQELVIAQARRSADNPGANAAEPNDPTPQPTPPPAPTAPVISAASGGVQPASDPAARSAAICVLLFHDANHNRIQEAGEALLAGGRMSLSSGGRPPVTHETDGASEPHCFAELATGDYAVSAAPPDGFGLTTPGHLTVQARSGMTLNVVFGAADGVVSPPPPPASTTDAAPPGRDIISREDETRSAVRTALQDFGSLLAFGAAGVVLVGGFGLAFLIRRR